MTPKRYWQLYDACVKAMAKKMRVREDRVRELEEAAKALQTFLLLIRNEDVSAAEWEQRRAFEDKQLETALEGE